MRTQFSTHDPDVMVENVALAAPGAAIEKRACGRFSARVDAIRLSGLGLMRISARNIRVKIEPGDAAFTSLNVPLQGGFDIDRFRRCESYDGDSAFVQNLDRPFDLSSPSTSVLVANFDDSYLKTTASKASHGERGLPSHLRKKLSLSSQSGARLWRALYALWLRAGDERCSPASALAVSEAQDKVVDALLLATGFDDGSPESFVVRQNAFTALKRAEDWILANLDQPISRADLCDVSGLQLRALTRAFSNCHGQGPMQFVRDRRLDAVQRTLLGAERGETTVTRVATDFGFYHFGRFSRDYCRTFGESPSETLYGQAHLPGSIRNSWPPGRSCR